MAYEPTPAEREFNRGQPAFPYVAPPPPPAPLWILIDASIDAGWDQFPQPVQHLDSILAPLQVEAARKLGVPWYTSADFDKGVPSVICHLAQMQLAGTIVIDSMTPCGQAAIEYLRPRAAAVIRRSR